MIKVYRLGSIDFNKFSHQCEFETLDFVEGTLLDSMYGCGRRGYYFFKEVFINTWTSGYYVYFAAYKDRAAVVTLDNMWSAFAGADVVETA